MNEQEKEMLERIAALEKEFAALKSQVDTINKFVSAIAESQSLETTMNEIESVAKQLTTADKATFYCYDNSNDKFFSHNDYRKWQDTQSADELKKIFVGQKIQNREKDKAYIPLVNSKGNSMGVIVAEKESGFKRSDFDSLKKGSQVINTVELALQKEYEHQGRIKDNLTGLKNREGLDEYLATTLCPNLNNDVKANIIVIDIDDFKKINDTYGHDAGDTVLRNVADVLKDFTRDGADASFRIGGEEMVCIVYCDDDKAVDIAERLKEAVSNRENKLNINGTEENIKVTVSVGVSEILPNKYEEISPRTINGIYNADFKHSDNALYKAKERGKNQVVSFSDAAYKKYIIGKTAEVLCGDNKEAYSNIKEQIGNCLNSRNYSEICNVVEALQDFGENNPQNSKAAYDLIDTITNKTWFDDTSKKLFDFKPPVREFSMPKKENTNNLETFSLKINSQQAKEILQIAKEHDIHIRINFTNGIATVTHNTNDNDFADWVKQNYVKNEPALQPAPQKAPIVSDYEQDYKTAFSDVHFENMQNRYSEPVSNAPAFQKPKTYEKKEPKFFNKEGYKAIDNKTYIQTDAKTAYEISKFAQEKGVENSAKYQGNNSAVTVDGIKNRGFIEAVRHMSEWADKVQIKAAQSKDQQQNRNNNKKFER